MTDLTIGQAQRMTAPAPFALLTSADKEGKTNIMAVSWWTYLSNHPVKIGACLSNKGYSGGNIREGGEFAICVVDEQLKDSALQCGRCSGRSTPKVVAASKVVFECKLSDMLEVGDHTFFAADVVAVYGDDSKKQLFAYDGYGRLGTAVEG